jgi:hypothetical protein
MKPKVRVLVLVEDEISRSKFDKTIVMSPEWDDQDDVQEFIKESLGTMIAEALSTTTIREAQVLARSLVFHYECNGSDGFDGADEQLYSDAGGYLAALENHDSRLDEMVKARELP